MRYEDFDDYEYSRSGSRRGSSSARGSGSYRDYDDYGKGYGRSDYQDYDRYGDYDYDRYGSSPRSSRFDDFDRYDWERTAPNWDRRSGGSSGGKRRSSERSASGSRRSSSRDSRDRRDNRDRRDSRERRDSRDSRDRRDSGRSRSGSQSRSRSSYDSSRRRDRDRRDRAYEERRGPSRMIPIAIGLVVLILAAVLVKVFVLGGGGSSDYKISFESETIVVGETTTATVTGVPDGVSPSVNWISGDTNVVAIAESDGVSCTLTAKSEGTATIAATLTIEGEEKEVSISGTVEVVETAPGVLGITLANETATVFSGETYNITATVNMEEGYSPAKITWTSNDASVARVDENGVVSARDVGTAIITATAGEKTAEFIVTVVENPNGTPPDDSQIANKADETSVTGESPASSDSSGDSGSTGNSDGSGESGTADNSGSTDTSGDSAGTGETGASEAEGSTDNSQLSSEITGESPAE